MRNLLSCLALAMIVGIIGCGEPAAPATQQHRPIVTALVAAHRRLQLVK